jgi:paraquat-inducible protein B
MAVEPQERPVSAAPRAVVRARARPSIVWFVPLVAALVGLYLAYWAWSEQGPTITIIFDRADGLVAGQTKLKYKDVNVGLVESVDLTDDLKQVRVTASMVKELANYLTDQTRFWVVRAEVSAAEISGVDTLLSGAYVAVDPSSQGERTRVFEGLPKAPVVRSDKPGTLFKLRARELGSVDVGSPVYYRWLRVGQIAGYTLDQTGDSVSVQVFIESPHDERVRSTTRFWNASGLDAVVTAEGLQIDTPSLMTMLVGGIAFETPATVTVAEDVPANMVFELYPNKQATRRPRYLLKSRFLLYFEDSVSGLVPGSPVEFRGIKLGEVLDVDIDYDRETTEMRIPVVIEIEPERLGLTHEDVEQGELELMQRLVERGLRARLATNNMLTGQKAVDFDFLPGAKPARVERGRAYPVLPTASGGIDAITERITRIVDRVDQVPIESIGQNLDEVFRSLAATLSTVEQITEGTNRDLMPKLVGTLERLEDTLASADSMISPDSAMAQELGALVGDLAEAAASLKLMAERLEERPEELLRGKGG